MDVHQTCRAYLKTGVGGAVLSASAVWTLWARWLFVVRDDILFTVGYLRASWLLPPRCQQHPPSPPSLTKRNVSRPLPSVVFMAERDRVSPVNTIPISAGIGCWEDTQFMFWIKLFWVPQFLPVLSILGNHVYPLCLLKVKIRQDHFRNV